MDYRLWLLKYSTGAGSMNLMSQLDVVYYIDETKAIFNKNKKLSDLLDQIREKCTREVYELLGSKVTDYMTFRQSRETMQKLCDF
jgi:hypothetical protein